MPQPKSKQKAPAKDHHDFRHSPQALSASTVPLDVVNPYWLAKAVVLTALASLLCAWLALCLLFYQGQWQFVLHPQRSDRTLDALAGVPATPIHFDAGETGVPRLSGALIPASQPARLTPYTLLYLRGEVGCLSTSQADAANLAVLHGLGLTVFAFDYRGFGASDPTHPSLERVTQDAEAAIRYLEISRGLDDRHILLYGTGVGASLATTLAYAHPAVPVLLLDSPNPPEMPILQSDPRTRALPVRWLFHEDFSLAGLSSLKTPKLLISYPKPRVPVPPAYLSAADPKTTIELSPGDPAQVVPAITRFLDQYLPGGTPVAVKE